ncbi:hypothetical protein EJ08DRAFT_307352 [Tothia fuscella]|uniref:Uncharacterized protein n=1 Tax=Tothia fuscella TaxID=1048955 RepID=A0A9P4TXK2_9PEZI|nr:hypothetical protein EJ08DRAFT_307352 [Tothia fuscella]
MEFANQDPEALQGINSGVGLLFRLPPKPPINSPHTKLLKIAKAIAEDPVLNLEPTDALDDVKELTILYFSRSEPCMLCQCPLRAGELVRNVFGEEERFHGSTLPVEYGRDCNHYRASGRTLGDFYISIKQHKPQYRTTHTQKSFCFHEECFQYLQTNLNIQQINYGKRVFAMLWTLGLSVSLDYAHNDDSNEKRAQLSIEDSILDGRSLKLQISIARQRDVQFASLLSRIKELPDEVILNIPRFFYSPSDDHNELGHYARLAVVFSQATAMLRYIGEQYSGCVNDLHLKNSPAEITNCGPQGVAAISAQKEIYCSTVRFGGRDYVTNLANSSFPQSEILPRPEHPFYAIVTTDKIGLVDFRLVKSGESLLKLPEYDGVRR